MRLHRYVERAAAKSTGSTTIMDPIPLAPAEAQPVALELQLQVGSAGGQDQSGTRDAVQRASAPDQDPVPTRPGGERRPRSSARAPRSRGESRATPRADGAAHIPARATPGT